MTIEVRNSFSEYLSLSIFLLYRKTGTKILLLIFILVFGNLTLQSFGVTAIDEKSNDQNLLLSWIICVAVPALLFLSIYLKIKRNYFSDKRVLQKVIYKIEGNELVKIAESFESKRDLNKSFKIEETKKWFLIFETVYNLDFISKKALTKDEVIALRDILGTQINVK